jgi:glycosyltransferase involved in cell wall biosynthesis
MLAMARRLAARGHEVLCLTSAAFPDGLEDLRQDIERNAPYARLSSFRITAPCAAYSPENGWRQMAARLLREHAIACLEPDFVHVPALLADGWGDDAVGSVGMLGVHVPTSLTQHDLIPLVMSDIYMPEGPFRRYYLKKLEGVKQADLLLAISEYSRQEAIEQLAVPAERVVYISSAADEMFAHLDISLQAVERTLVTFGLTPGFLLYAPGGFDARKNIDRLLEAYALLPSDFRVSHRLVIASKLEQGVREGLEWKAGTFGIQASEIVLTDYVADDELMHLYRACHLYVFPSLHEGFGLPALEAMCCGAPVIASNCTGIPEVIGMQEALFDPYSVQSMAEKIRQAFDDTDFRQRLIAHAAVQPHKFSWEESAQLAVSALEQKHAMLKKKGWCRIPRAALPSCDAMLAMLASQDYGVGPSDEDVHSFRDCFEANMMTGAQ